MAEDLDFDALLAELDEPKEVKEEVAEVKEEVAEVKEEVTEVTEVAEEKDNSVVVTNPEEIIEYDLENEAKITAAREVPLEEIAENNKNIINEHIENVGITVDDPDISESDSEAEAFFKENLGIYKSYIKEVFEFEEAVAKLKEDFKEVQADYKDRGISIGSVKKAIRNIKESLKENSEEAAAVVGVETMISGDANLMAELTSQVNG